VLADVTIGLIVKEDGLMLLVPFTAVTNGGASLTIIGGRTISGLLPGRTEGGVGMTEWIPPPVK